MAETHVVFGTGPIGRSTAAALRATGIEVRMVNRTGHVPEVPGTVEVVAADASDPRATIAAVAGATVVYQCLNPAYHRWAEDFPPLQDAIIAACQAHDARLVSFENVYMYGDTGGEPMTESTRLRPHTRKGRVRLHMSEQLRRLSDADEIDVATARASDYFGPGGVEQSPLGALVIGRALDGKSALVVGDPDQPHSYTFTEDAGRTLAALGTRDDVSGEVFHVPNAPARPTREIVALIGELLRRRIAVRATPRPVLRALGLANPAVREIVEMLYEFEQPFIVDSSKAQTRLGLDPTPLYDALRTTIEWFRQERRG